MDRILILVPKLDIGIGLPEKNRKKFVASSYDLPFRLNLAVLGQNTGVFLHALLHLSSQIRYRYPTSIKALHQLG
jgi:hypothetical protein